MAVSCQASHLERRRGEHPEKEEGEQCTPHRGWVRAPPGTVERRRSLLPGERVGALT